MQSTRYLATAIFLGALEITSASAQSVLSTLRGTIHDAGGAVLAHAHIDAVRSEDGTDHRAVTDAAGDYSLVDLPPGTYTLSASYPGFNSRTAESLHLLAREHLRYDFMLQVAGAKSESVTVDASAAGVINTSDGSISAALTPDAVLNLPANYRGAGSTSPLDVIQVLPGVQPDSGAYPPPPSASPNPGIKFSLQGGLPSQTDTTVDGISAQNLTTNNALGDAFPSAEDIAEIRVDGVNNNAEYGQPGEITTVTRGGTNNTHGSVYWYFQNSGFDAIPFGTDAANKPKKVANDFGASLGGPARIPHLYDGHNRSFYFLDYEGLRYATSRVVQYVVPTTLMKAGDFSQEVAVLNNPFTGGVYPNRTVTPNASSAALLSLFPDPNLHVGQSVASVLADPAQPYNYLSTKPNNLDSDQFDIRVDQNFGSRATAFARYTNKDIKQVLPADLALPNGTAFARYRILAASLNYFFTPKLANEVRFGFTLEQDGMSNPLDGSAFTANAHFTGLPNFPFNGVPHLGFQYLTSGGERLNASERSRLFQYVDNLTWQRGSHTVRVGLDIRHLEAFTPLDFSSSDNYGNFFFGAPSYTGNEFADFLAGVPYLSQVDNIQADNNGAAMAYAVYGQDSWVATPRLSLTFGLRYELHPAFASTNGEIGNFDPSVPKSGRLLYPAGYASLLSAPELAGFNACPTAGISNPGATGAPANGAPCTPVVSNTQAGLPAGLRTTPRLRFEPRLGFAFRPFNNEKTAIRGGAGYYNITTSGALFYALTGTLQSNLQSYNNAVSAAGPLFSFPGTGSNAALAGAPAPGTGVFYSAVDIHWHDPYSLQTNLSVDQALGAGFGLRASYIGLETWHLIWQPELNMLTYNKTTVAALQPRTAFPFPNFDAIYNRATSATSNYQSGQVELSRRGSHGMFFDSAYTFAKNLADNQGTYGASQQAASFVDEQGGYDATYSYDRHLDYGNVTGTRRHRWITTGVYPLPVGRGQRYAPRMPALAEAAIGGWQLSGIFALQSGPFLTAYLPSGNVDPSGTGSGTLYFRQQRPDRVARGNFAAHNRGAWFNKAAFACPGGTGLHGTSGFASLQNGDCAVGGFDYSNPANPVPVTPIGRFGSESIGDLNGPGTVALSTGLSKTFSINERLHLRTEGTFTNVLNHTNLADPVLDVTSPSFGVIRQSRGSDFSGSRTGQVTLRLEF